TSKLRSHAPSRPSMVSDGIGAFCAAATCGSTALRATDLSSITRATKRGQPCARARDGQHLAAAMLHIDAVQNHLLDAAPGKDDAVMAHDRDLRVLAERGGKAPAELRRVDIFGGAAKARRRFARTRDRAQRLRRRAVDHRIEGMRMRRGIEIGTRAENLGM